MRRRNDRLKTERTYQIQLESPSSNYWLLLQTAPNQSIKTNSPVQQNSSSKGAYGVSR